MRSPLVREWRERPVPRQLTGWPCATALFYIARERPIRSVNAPRHPLQHSRERDPMSQEDKLSEIAQEIDAGEISKTRDANNRVSDAYGADSKGLIVLPVDIKVPKSGDLY
jgi:hypothetical protein